MDLWRILLWTNWNRWRGIASGSRATQERELGQTAKKSLFQRLQQVFFFYIWNCLLCLSLKWGHYICQQTCWLSLSQDKSKSTVLSYCKWKFVLVQQMTTNDALSQSELEAMKTCSPYQARENVQPVLSAGRHAARDKGEKTSYGWFYSWLACKRKPTKTQDRFP